MKVKVTGKHLRFLEFTKRDLKILTKILTWEDEYAKKSGKEFSSRTLLFEDSEGYFTFFGLVDLIKEEFNEFIITEDDRDTSVHNVEVRDDVLEGVVLRGYQVAAVKKAVNLRRGIIEVPTAGGKSEIALAITRVLIDAGLIRKSLIITPSVPIVGQFKNRSLIRGFTNDEVGCIYGLEKDFSKPITFAVINTLAAGIKEGNSKILDLIKSADLIIMDEAHHAKSDSFLSVAYLSQSPYLIGLSGTPFKSRESILSDIGDSIIYGLIGRVIFKISQRTLVKGGFIADTAIFMKSVKGSLKKYVSRYNLIYKREIQDNYTRNKYIVDYCSIFADNGFSVIVSINVKEHAIHLMELLKEFYPNVKGICIFGGSEACSFDESDTIHKYKIDQESFFNDFESGNYKIIFATQVMDEGVDLPSVGALIMAGAGKSVRQVRQRLGRGVRSKKIGTNVVFILDFFDRGHMFMYQQSKKRLDIYLNEVESDVLSTESEFLDIIKSCSKHKEI